jgi:hypothetical protein
MLSDITSRMWAIYDETGIFVALCRHGFFILVADMYLSGELYVHLVFHSLLYSSCITGRNIQSLS